MMETKFQRRAAGLNGKLGVVGAIKGSLSPKGTIKKRKQDHKTKERQEEEMCSLNVQIGRLEDRDTQQQAFAILIESLPELDSSLVKEVYSLIEKNKKPTRSSTRRMLVLLVAALCRCHPVQTAKLVPQILSYVCLRLRDRHTKTTDACVILMSSIALYILPCSAVSLPGGQISPGRQRGNGSTQQPFEAVAAVFAKEANAVGEAATKCICGLLHPVDFDGVSVPGPGTILAHASRIRPFFKTLLAQTVAKMDGSTMFTTFSPLFLLLQSACQLAQDANEKASFTQLGDDFAPYIASIYEAIEDVFQCGSRDDWMLRKRGLELLTMILDTFALQDFPWCTAVGTAREYFQARLERVRTLVLAGRHDSVSLVREAAIPAALTFKRLEKLCPQTVNEPRSNASTNYDFVPPNPPGYSSIGKRRPKPTAANDRDTHVPIVSDASARSPTESIKEEDTPSFGDHTTGDEDMPSHDVSNEEDDLATALSATNEAKVIRSRSNGRVNTVVAADVKLTNTPLPTELNQDDERFMDLLMDHAEAPENGDDADHPQSDDEQSGEIPHIEQSEESVAHNAPLASAARVVSQTKPRSSTATVVQGVATLKQFAAKQRAQARSRRSQHQYIPQISLPKRRTSQVVKVAADTHAMTNHHINETEAKKYEKDDGSGELELTRTEAALEAAQCGEYELAFRLCIVEDDLELLRRTMTIIKTPCLTMLSSAARSALCTAFLSLLDGDGDEDSSDLWLVLQWLQQWAVDIECDERQFEQLDPRVAQGLCTKLNEMAVASTKSALAAARVLCLLGR